MTIKRHNSWQILLMLGIALPGVAAVGGDYEWKDGQWVRQAAAQEGTATGELSLIRQAVETGHRNDAVHGAKKFQKRYPDAPQLEEVLFLAGEGEFRAGRYYQAFEWYERQLNAHPSGELSERALKREFDVAELFLAGKKRVVLKFLWLPAEDEGLEILQRIPEHVPGTTLAEKALLRVGDHQFAMRRWEDAAQAYDHYLELFGKWPRAEYAMLQSCRATHNQYRGPQYDDTPLLEARQRYKNFQTQFPQAARNANVPATQESIANALAQKMFTTAAFYQRTHQPQPASYYYRLVIDQYPDSPAAGEAYAALNSLEPVIKPSPTAVARAASQPAAAPDKPSSFPPPSPVSPAAPAKNTEERSREESAKALAKFITGAATQPSQPAPGSVTAELIAPPEPKSSQVVASTIELPTTKPADVNHVNKIDATPTAASTQPTTQESASE